MTSKQHTSRISAGEYRYRTIYQPASAATRPVSQKLRAAIFDTLGHDLKGLRVLDLYAGSAALALEAMSRGARTATTVESDKLAQRSILANQRDFGISLGLQDKSVEEFFESNQDTFDIIFFDPPYATFSIAVADKAAQILNAGGVLLISCGVSEVLPDQLGAASMVKARTYDQTQLAYYKSAP